MTSFWLKDTYAQRRSWLSPLERNEPFGAKGGTVMFWAGDVESEGLLKRVYQFSFEGLRHATQ